MKKVTEKSEVNIKNRFNFTQIYYVFLMVFTDKPLIILSSL